MPVKVENKLMARARKKGLKGKHKQAYVYGTMNKLGLLAEKFPRLVELAAKIDLGDKPSEAGCCSPCETPRRIYFPSVYISGRKAPIDIPNKGKAMIEYRVTGRSMNQRGEEEAKHSTDIEIHSIEPVEDKEDKKPKEGEAAKLLEDVRRLRQFARGDLLKRVLPGAVGEHAKFYGLIDPLKKRGMSQAILANTLAEHRAAGFRPTFRTTTPAKLRARLGALGLLEMISDKIIEFADSRPRNAMGEYTAQEDAPGPDTMTAAYGPPNPPHPADPAHVQRIKSFFAKRRQASGDLGAAPAAAAA